MIDYLKYMLNDLFGPNSQNLTHVNSWFRCEFTGVQKLLNVCTNKKRNVS